MISVNRIPSRGPTSAEPRESQPANPVPTGPRLGEEGSREWADPVRGSLPCHSRLRRRYHAVGRPRPNHPFGDLGLLTRRDEYRLQPDRPRAQDGAHCTGDQQHDVAKIRTSKLQTDKGRNHRAMPTLSRKAVRTGYWLRHDRFRFPSALAFIRTPWDLLSEAWYRPRVRAPSALGP